MRAYYRHLAAFLLLCLGIAVPPSHALQAPAQDPFKLGVAALDDSRYKAAEDYFNAALAIHPDNPTTLINLGIAYLAQNRLRDAFAILQLARVQAPENHLVHFHLAQLYYRANLRELERKSLIDAIHLDPNNIALHLNLAHSLTLSGAQYAAAMEYDWLLARTHQDGTAPDPTVLYQRALIHEAQGQPAAAIDLLTRYLDSHPSQAGARQAEQRLQRLQGKVQP